MEAALYTPFVLFYVVPFGVGVVMPGWRALGVWAILGTLVFATLLFPGAGDSPGGAIGMLFGIVGAAAFAAGVAARAAMLALRREQAAPAVHVLVTIAAFVLPPLGPRPPSGGTPTATARRRPSA
jgi:hypothetical protein